MVEMLTIQAPLLDGLKGSSGEHMNGNVDRPSPHAAQLPVQLSYNCIQNHLVGINHEMAEESSALLHNGPQHLAGCNIDPVPLFEKTGHFFEQNLEIQFCNDSHVLPPHILATSNGLLILNG